MSGSSKHMSERDVQPPRRHRAIDVGQAKRRCGGPSATIVEGTRGSHSELMRTLPPDQALRPETDPVGGSTHWRLGAPSALGAYWRALHGASVGVARTHLDSMKQSATSRFAIEHLADAKGSC